jgi:lipoyl(octanoyl) transferase
MSKAAHFHVHDLGRLAYGPALERQRAVNEAVVAGEAPPTLLLVEHEPVITVSQRRNARAHLLADERQLASLGIGVHETDRGGDITYHGPGQLVAYPILRLNPLGLNLGRYMRLLEAAVIDALGDWDITGYREEGATGVWVGGDVQLHLPGGKICAMGVRVRKNVTMHGLALNVNPELTHFQTIVPCGLTGSSVTSLAAILGDRCPAMNEVQARLVHHLDAACQRAEQQRKQKPASG